MTESPGGRPPETLYDSRTGALEDAPAVSLIVPLYNVRPYLAACLSGVLAAQTTLPLEILLIDDGSSDGTTEEVLKILARRNPGGVLFCRQENRGLSAVRNLGVRLARGRYLGFLDSDDLMVSGSLAELHRFAVHNHCDMVLGRSFVFDSKSEVTSPFYDAWAFEALLGGARSRVVSRHEDYRLYFLEPNANYRLIRRQFYLDLGLSYPEGRLFEDPPVHFKLLAQAARIGLVDVPYYGYRVNRPGKITEARSHRRFDILPVAEETFKALKQEPIPERAGGALVHSLSRIVWWCGTMTLPEDREPFYREAIEVFQTVPPSWLMAFRALSFPDEMLHLVVGALIRRDLDRLVELSQKRRNRLRSALYLLRLRRWDLLLRHARSALRLKGRLRRAP